MNTDTAVGTAARYGSVITADAKETGIPERIEVMRAGDWPPENNKGRALSITANDLQEFANNFKAGIGVPGGKDFGQIPIDFAHNDNLEAAGWITDLTVENGILFASVTWTSAGKTALEGGLYKCFSPSFWPACLGVYPDPENHNITAKNVLVGGGLTNIPFFKDLTAIMASNAGNSQYSNNNKGAEMPTFDEVRIKEVASLTADDKKVLVENAEKMSADEKTKFVDVLPKVDATAKPVEATQVNGLNEADAQLLADLKSGKYVAASEHEALKASVGKLEADAQIAKEATVKASVETHVARGAIKADQVDEWTKRIVADSTLEPILAAIPSNKLIAAEIGTGSEQNDATNAFESKVKAHMEANQGTTYAQAVVAVANADSGLANSHEQQIKQ